MVKERLTLKNPERWNKPHVIAKEKLEAAAKAACDKLKANTEKFGLGFPGTCSVNYKYVRGANNNWECGMYTGCYWLAYELTGDEFFKDCAEKMLETFYERVDKKIGVDDHDVGFVFSPSCVAAYKLTGNEEAKKKAPIMLQAQEMLRKWEAKDAEVRALWEKMNGWVYDGFDVTYKTLGVDFDKVYYESQTYILGKGLVEDGLAKGIFFRKEDGSVWIDLEADGLDQKLLLRGDGTSVYMTQDLGTALQRFEQNALYGIIYVVGNEQNYHFQVLKLILKKLGYEWSDDIFHLSYGMVELPEGKMKSREGTVVDADDLCEAMINTAREMSQELGKLDGCSEEEALAISSMVGLGALKYFILKVDPKKTMLFDPRESIDFNGNTGPFIQYTHARICSVLRKAAEQGISFEGEKIACDLLSEEVELVKMLCDYPTTVLSAGEAFAPSMIAAYTYELCKTFNGYYHDHSILREENEAVKKMRLALAQQVARVINRSMRLLGIDVPERM